MRRTESVFVIVKLFALGLPGSGKSTVAQHIVKYIEQNRIYCAAMHISDYSILYKKFLDDKRIGGGRFKSSEYGGFQVLDHTVYKEALHNLEQCMRLLSSEAAVVVVVEFARVNYEEALDQFSQGFLQDAYFLFLDVDIDTCKKRVNARVNWPTSPDPLDDHFVPNEVLELYRQKDNRSYISSVFKEVYGISDHRVLIIANSGDFQDVARLIEQFVEQIFQSCC